MVQITVRQLIDLVASGCPDPEARIEKLFDWSHARQLELAKTTFAASIALFVPVALSFFKNEFSQNLSQWWLIAAVFGAVTLAMVGFGMLVKLRHAYRAVIAAQSLLGEVRKIAPFVARYRSQVDRQW